MDVQTVESGSITILTLAGSILGGPDATVLNEQINALLEKGKCKIVLNLGGVETMNSSGLGMLIRSLTAITNAGGKLKLASASSKIQNLLTMTKLTSLFEHYPTVQKAVDSFS